MSKIITVKAEIDLDEYEDEILEYYKDALTPDITEKYGYNLLLEYVEELNKDLYFRARPTERTVESVFNDLQNIIRKVNEND